MLLREELSLGNIEGELKIGKEITGDRRFSLKE